MTIRHFCHILARISMTAACMAVISCSSYENPSITSSHGNLNVVASVDASFRNSAGSPVMLSDLPAIADSISMTITDLATGAKHTWSSLDDYNPMEGLRTGDYRVSLRTTTIDNLLEFVCDTMVSIRSGETSNLNVTLRPSQAWAVITTASSAPYGIDSVITHSLISGKTCTITGNDAFPQSGINEFVATVSDGAGRSVNLTVGEPVTLQAGYRYDLKCSSSNNAVVITDDAERLSCTTQFSDDIFSAGAPTVTTSGFTSDIAMQATEGVTLSEPVRIDVSSQIPLNHLYLAIVSPLVNLIEGNTDAFEFDLLNPSVQDMAMMETASLLFTVNDTKTIATIDFTRLVENLSSRTTALSSFTLRAENAASIVADPVTLSVNTRSVSFEVVSVEPAVIGKNISHIILRPSLPGVEVSDITIYTTGGDNTSICPIITSTRNSDLLELDIRVPDGTASLPVQLDFMGLKRCSFTIGRKVPEFGVFPDGYATSARMKIVAHDDETARGLTRMLHFSVDRNRASIAERDTSECVITINGLSPDHKYRLDAYLSNTTSVMTTTFTTEPALAIPDGDFEDAGLEFEYKHLPSGGRYALTSLDVINRQNYVDVTLYWPKKYWASVNERTFCRNASVKNTWYMQLSSEIDRSEYESGAKSIKITSVGWNMNGSPIADWVPNPGTPPASYNANVPTMGQRSAGRLFLGKYTFDPNTNTEIFEEGVPFTSRPSSLNGFYKYQPDITAINDRGLVTIQLVSRDSFGNDIVIADGRMTFGSCPDFMAFNVPLEYSRPDLHPTHLKIMFMSSSLADDKPIDDSDVPVTPLPERSAFIGSTLWVDNLSFTY